MFTLTEAVRGRSGCREAARDGRIEGLAGPLNIGSFSTSRTSIFLVRLATLKELIVSRWYDRTGAKLRIITVSPLFWPKERILVILDSRYGIRCCFFVIASTHCAKTKRLLLILADSTIRSLSFSVRRLSSEPARSIAEAVLMRVLSGEVTVTFTPRMACERDEWAFN